ncbi:TetR/AcrR family transcriptional regulator [Calothrix sp. UHCC 0171]|uniref:TetR/AcrR family transcriptional regulator n=1 Tax=Calothrix sp. UHCC 0171 TaxID=3110245 RepID=UPI002B202FBA|nr:TetR/AcrR family transcriptional regulator [Calothrix sp. UHCC 0171]MEA5570710.1 TetR/AcrR family transcriptional regulator [Calothrix sp. UHCC 0171]
MNSTHERLMQAALELFTTQGVANTTTRQIAELAGVNEVTLFRQFGNKHGLLLALFEESERFTNLAESLVEEINPADDAGQILKNYASNTLLTFERVPDFIRSVVGEASQYPPESRRALGKGLKEVNRKVGEYFANAIAQGLLTTSLPVEKLAALVNTMTLGYAIIEFTSEMHEFWQDRDEFLETLVELFVAKGLDSSANLAKINQNLVVTTREIVDLPGNLVHQILHQAKKSSVQDFALAYLLFATGIYPTEITTLQITQQIADTQANILQITTPKITRQVPVNQWVMGKRYGSYTNNPLTRWLKSRKDNQTAMFINEAGLAMSALEIEECWQKWTETIVTPEGKQPTISQTQPTWCVEMLMRGMSLENLSILTGLAIAQLQPLAHRAKEKAAIEQATRLDQKPG